MQSENSIVKDKHVLVCIDEHLSRHHISPDSLLYAPKELVDNFCGKVVRDAETEITTVHDDAGVYICGDVKAILQSQMYKVKPNTTVFVVRELAYNYDDDTRIVAISLGRVPINIHNVAVYFKQLFDEGEQLFHAVNNQHEFQRLRESDKNNYALRKGLYLSKMNKTQELEDRQRINFWLLRCSSNFEGPTENFRSSDMRIADQVYKACVPMFSLPFDLNHVLAQIYYNNSETNKTKASIKAHSDKTKDMPREGVIAFVTFYDFSTVKTRKTKNNKRISFHDMLTTLVFRAKDGALQENPSLQPQFSVTLHPNSVLVIPLRTNRLYTHEIRPSPLPFADQIPTRMGYVMRCSAREAAYAQTSACRMNGTAKHEGHTLVKNTAGGWEPLQKMTEEDAKLLRSMYHTENTTTEVMDYGKMNFSMNSGDYMIPSYA